jgi:hypothetical protein
VCLASSQRRIPHNRTTYAKAPFYIVLKYNTCCHYISVPQLKLQVILNEWGDMIVTGGSKECPSSYLFIIHLICCDVLRGPVWVLRGSMATGEAWQQAGRIRSWLGEGAKSLFLTASHGRGEGF